MKYFLSFLLVATVMVAADLPSYISTIEARNRFEEVFYRVTTFAGNTIAWRKSPAETRAVLSTQIQAEANEARLYYLRAREAELQLDFAAAEADLVKYVQLAPNKGPAWTEKANYHHRRLEPAKEIAALLEAKLFSRALVEVKEQLLDPLPIYQAWEAAEPNSDKLYAEYLPYLLSRKNYAEYEAVLGRRKFPDQLERRAALEQARSGAAAAAAVYDREAPESASYYALLVATKQLRAYQRAQQERVGREPRNLDPVRRLFWMHFHAGNRDAAQRLLYEFRQRGGSEPLALARLYEAAQNLDEAAQFYSQVDGEDAMASLATLLLQNAGQPIRQGSGDLSLFSDIGGMDRSPGLLNGVLSLVFNTSYPAAELATEENRARPYFHRAKAAELVTLFDSRFPNSTRRAGLRALVIQAFAAHGEHGAVIRQGQQFLTTYPKAPERVAVSLQMASAYAAQRNLVEEFKVYDALLGELGSGHAQYKAILDRAIARYVAARRVNDALALQRKELDRNPTDPALYERLAAFLEQNRMGAEIESVYRRAMQQFPDKSWSHKLARWYLRAKMNAKYDALSKEVAAVFAGTELEEYLKVTAAQGQLDPVLYRQVNTYAMTRFPHHMAFVKNLVDAHGARATANPAEQERLLRSYWIYDEGLRQQFFSLLSRTGRLDAELASVRAALPQGDATAQTRANPAAATWVAEAEAWRSHFEVAAPYLRAVSQSYPGDISLLTRTAMMHRSLGNSAVALELTGALAKAWPRESRFLTEMGEIHADGERFAAAGPLFDQVARIAPGKAESWLESATLHWDYFQYDDAIRQLTAGRQQLGQPAAFAFEMGAIYENKGQMAAALREYLAGAMAVEGDSPARGRLIRLARRQPVEAAIGALPVDGKSIGLRVALLEAQGRREDLERYLTATAGRSEDLDLLQQVTDVASRNGLAGVQRAVYQRQIALAADPLEAIRLRMAKARFEESQGQLETARSEMDALLAANRKRLAVVRAAAQLHKRTGDAKRSIAILRAAADGAHRELQRSLRLEAGRMAEPAVALALADQVLAVDPVDGEGIALKADAYARAKDDAGLTAFYKAKLGELKDAAQIAQLREAYIPALTRLRDFNGAVDQYIELAKRSPEDEGLVRTAARYAAANGAKDRLLAYFAKAETDSPRDARWPVVRARLEHEFGSYPAALAAWSRAVSLRPERTDLLMARGDLETRLLRFEEAAATYQKLYELSYRNPVWLERVAETRARQGRTQEATTLLKQAYSTGKPNHVAIARKLEEWGLLDSALASFQAAGADAGLDQARVLTRLRRYEEVRSRADGVLSTSASAAAAYYSPEEKAKYAVWLEAQGDGNAARSAGFLEVGARITQRFLMGQPGSEAAQQRVYELVDLQNRRGRFAELGQQLEAYWKVHPDNEAKANLLSLVAQAYRRAGDAAGELRALSAAPLEGDNLDRYLRLRATVEPARAEALANYGLRTENAALVQRGLAGAPRSVAWKNAYRALAGLYFRQLTPEVKKSFADTLGPETIGAKLAAPKGGLAGDTWFYYAARYADYLELSNDAAASGYRPAMVESRSASAQAFFEAGDYANAIALNPHFGAAYARMGNPVKALEEYRWMMDNGRLSESWWEDVREALAAAPTASAGEGLLQVYVRRNGAYRLAELVAGMSAERLGRLALSAAEPAEFLMEFAGKSPELLDRAERLAEQRLAKAVGETREMAAMSLQRIRMRRLEHLVKSKQYASAAELLGRYSPEELRNDAYALVPLRLRVAAKTGGLATLLEEITDTEQLRLVAGQMEEAGEADAARQMLILAYTRELAGPNPPASSYLGLAEVQPERAVELLDRLVMGAGEPFAYHGAAARLLLRLKRPAEAARYAEPVAQAMPWSAESKLLLAQAKGDEATLVTVAMDRQAAYALRLEAAQAMNRTLTSGARELDLLAARITSPTEAEQPFVVTARLKAAEAVADPVVKLRLLRVAMAIEPSVRLTVVKALLAANRSAEMLALVQEGEVPPELREAVGDAYVRMGEPARALLFYEDRPTKLVAAQAEVDRRTRNESRRPMVQEGLEQPHAVKPRLLAGAR